MTYNELQKTAREYGDANFCAVIATALLTDSSYENAFGFLHGIGRETGKGFVWSTVVKCLEARGLSFELIAHRNVFNYKGRNRFSPMVASASGSFRNYNFSNLKTVSHIPFFLPVGTYVALTSNHVLIIKDGEVMDFTADRSHRVIAIYKVSGSAQPLPDFEMPYNMVRFKETGGQAPAPRRTRKDQYNYAIVRLDNGERIKLIKRLTNKTKEGISRGWTKLVIDPKAPLGIMEFKTGRIIAKHPESVSYI